jgi:hypothetical protein
MKWSVFYSESRCYEYKDDQVRRVIGRSCRIPTLRMALGISLLSRRTTPIAFCPRRTATDCEPPHLAHLKSKVVPMGSRAASAALSILVEPFRGGKPLCPIFLSDNCAEVIGSEPRVRPIADITILLFSIFAL